MSKTKTLEAWKATTSRMAKKTMGGITDEEAVKIAEYLTNRKSDKKEGK
ncbi:MAG: hypothetical protein HY934_10500 [Candidatus Firestonebacteria bacterium]|nr:hypothetical protein [Candidatus Firestonebacteria bacterium]